MTRQLQLSKTIGNRQLGQKKKKKKKKVCTTTGLLLQSETRCKKMNLQLQLQSTNYWKLQQLNKTACGQPCNTRKPVPICLQHTENSTELELLDWRLENTNLKPFQGAGRQMGSDFLTHKAQLVRCEEEILRSMNIMNPIIMISVHCDDKQQTDSGVCLLPANLFIMNGAFAIANYVNRTNCS